MALVTCPKATRQVRGRAGISGHALLPFPCMLRFLKPFPLHSMVLASCDCQTDSDPGWKKRTPRRKEEELLKVTQ